MDSKSIRSVIIIGSATLAMNLLGYGMGWSIRQIIRQSISEAVRSTDETIIASMLVYDAGERRKRGATEKEIEEGMIADVKNFRIFRSRLEENPFYRSLEDSTSEKPAEEYLRSRPNATY